MTNEEKFQVLKQHAIDNYENYVTLIRSLSYDDLNDLYNRLDLLKKYQNAIASNGEYRGFIYQTIGRWQKPFNSN